MLSDPGANRTIVANFFSSSYRLVGKVQVANSGLIGLLNDPTTEFLRIEDVSTARIQQPKKLAERANLVRMVKYNELMVGAYEYLWTGTNENGAQVPEGTYVCTVAVFNSRGNFTMSNKMLVIR